MKNLAFTLLVALLWLAPGAKGAVVVELFTSQGCSSCPPADALLGQLARDPDVIPIAYHVDYWNGLGWSDPFSAREWTLRQAQYVRAMHLPSAYTPQMVVGGTRQMVGSAAAVVRSAIADAARTPTDATITVSMAKGIAVVETNTSRAGLELLVVATQSAAVTNVTAGENGGRTLTDVAIARRLARVPNVAAGDQIHRVPIEGAHVVAMLQDPATMRIVAAAKK